MRILIALLAFTIPFGQPLASEIADTPPVFAHVNRDSVVARENPNGIKIASFQQDSELRVLAATQNWLFVSGISGGSYVRGWMWSDYLTPYQENLEHAPTKVSTESETGFIKSPIDLRLAKSEVIKQDIERYSSSCPCPYSIQPNGTQCRGQSAWESPGGKRPRCYPSDVTLIDLDRHFSVQN